MRSGVFWVVLTGIILREINGAGVAWGNIREHLVKRGFQARGKSCNHGLYMVGALPPQAGFMEARRIQDLFVPMSGPYNPIYTNLGFLPTQDPPLRVHGWMAYPVCQRAGERYPDPIDFEMRNKGMARAPKEGDCFNLGLVRDRRLIVNKAREIWRAGIHSVHLDFKGIKNGDINLLGLLAELAVARPPHKILSLGGAFLWPSGKARRKWFKTSAFKMMGGEDLVQWEGAFFRKEYYQEIFKYVDHLVVRDQGKLSDKLLRRPSFWRWQVFKFLKYLEGKKVEFKLGLPGAGGKLGWKVRGGGGGPLAQFLSTARGVKGALEFRDLKKWESYGLRDRSCPQGFGVVMRTRESAEGPGWRYFERLWVEDKGEKRNRGGEKFGKQVKLRATSSRSQASTNTSPR
jgi:hypothetical protein